MHPSNKITEENLHHAVFWHEPTPEKGKAYKIIADACFDFMTIILKFAPDCADRTAALRCAREARMWANSSIALDNAPEHQ
jgi:hypothetical protein